jgi:hypothetical protein
MQLYTLNDIRALKPCYDPTQFLPENWVGTVADILRVKDCPAHDRLWVVLHPGWIDAPTLRLFAVWCARQALALMSQPDPYCVAACEMAERYLTGQATIAELGIAAAAACSVAVATCSIADYIIRSGISAVYAADVNVRDCAYTAANVYNYTAADIYVARENQVHALLNIIESK